MTELQAEFYANLVLTIALAWWIAGAFCLLVSMIGRYLRS